MIKRLKLGAYHLKGIILILLIYIPSFYLRTKML